MIPKRIFYIWFGKEQMNSHIMHNLKNWQDKNPGYELIQINETNFNVNEYAFIKKAYNSKNWAFASDMARLVTIYKYGGFYFDIDVEMIKSLDSLLKYKSVWGTEIPGVINSGLIVGAQSGDDDLKNLIDIYNQMEFDPKNLNSMLTPKIISNYFQEKGLINRNTVQKLKNDTVIFSTDYFAPYHWWGGGKITQNTVAIHQYYKGWGEQQIKLGTRLIAKFHYAFPEFYNNLRAIKNNILSKRK